MMGGEGAVGDKGLKIWALHKEEGREPGGGALTVHPVVGWEDAPRNLQESDVRAAKMRQ